MKVFVNPKDPAKVKYASAHEATFAQPDDAMVRKVVMKNEQRVLAVVPKTAIAPETSQ